MPCPEGSASIEVRCHRAGWGGFEKTGLMLGTSLDVKPARIVDDRRNRMAVPVERRGPHRVAQGRLAGGAEARSSFGDDSQVAHLPVRRDAGLDDRLALDTPSACVGRIGGGELTREV